MNITAQQAYVILRWQKVYSSELGPSIHPQHIQLIRSLVECLKDCHDVVHEYEEHTYHHLYEHYKEHVYNEYF